MFRMIKESAAEFKKLRTLTASSLMVALGVALGYISVLPTQFLRISVTFLPIAAVGALFGPVAGGVAGALVDLLGALIHPVGPYFPGFTISGFLTGFIFGLLLYKREPGFRRPLIACAINDLLINVCLSSLWLSILFGKGIWVYMSGRLVKNLVLIPVEALLIFLLQKLLARIPLGKN